MERDATAQREALNRILADANTRMEAFVDKTIQMSNVATMSAYVSAGSQESKVWGMIVSHCLRYQLSTPVNFRTLCKHTPM